MSRGVEVLAKGPAPVCCDASANRAARPAMLGRVYIGIARVEHAEVREIVPSAHCIQRFRQRLPIRSPGIEQVARELLAVLEGCDISAWPPGWAVSDEPPPLWAISHDGELAFPLQRTPQPGRWLAVTCLRRSRR
jgi:hypothetical protein